MDLGERLAVAERLRTDEGVRPSRIKTTRNQDVGLSRHDAKPAIA